MKIQTLAHLSDLHFGRSEETRRSGERLVRELRMRAIDHVVVTGDVTHRGKAAEYAQFLDVFAPLLDEDRVTLVPGNHDRLGDDIAESMMSARRVDVVERDGLHLVRVDSTAPHNRYLIAGHGALCDRVIADVESALHAAPTWTLRAVLLHHHVLPAPTETLSEHLADLVALPFANELALGGRLLERASGLVDLVLHGHRHHPSAMEMHGHIRTLGLYNAGSSTELGAARVFHHENGALVGPVEWLHTEGHHEHVVAPLAQRIDPRPHAVPRAAAGARRASA